MADNNIDKTHEFDKSESGLHKLFTCGGWNIIYFNRSKQMEMWS